MNYYREENKNKTKILLTITLAFIINFCNAQILGLAHYPTKNTIILKHFDDKQKDTKYEQDTSYISPNGDRIDLMWGGNDIGYIQKITPKNSMITHYKTYHPNGYLKSTVDIFNNSFFLGKEIIYDKNGTKIKKIDHDKDFKFTIYDVAKRIKKEFSVDVFIESKEALDVGIIRFVQRESRLIKDEKKYNIYIIYIPEGDVKVNRTYVNIEIDADTGKEIDRMKYLGGPGGNFMEALNEHRNKRKTEKTRSSIH